jgi:hypothetical protein
MRIHPLLAMSPRFQGPCCGMTRDQVRKLERAQPNEPALLFDTGPEGRSETDRRIPTISRKNLARNHAEHQGPAAGVRFDRRVGSFVCERSSKLASRLNAGRKTHLPQQTTSPTSGKQIASLQFENASRTNCLPDNSWNIYARQGQAV